MNEQIDLWEMLNLSERTVKLLQIRPVKLQRPRRTPKYLFDGINSRLLCYAFIPG